MSEPLNPSFPSSVVFRQKNLFMINSSHARERVLLFLSAGGALSLGTGLGPVFWAGSCRLVSRLPGSHSTLITSPVWMVPSDKI